MAAQLVNQASRDIVVRATEDTLISQAYLLRATALHSLNQWKLFLHQHLRDKYNELLPGFDALPSAQKKERINDMRDFYLKLHLDEEVKGLQKGDIWAKTAGGCNLGLWYEFLYQRIDALPAVTISTSIPAAATPASISTPSTKKQKA